MRSNAPTRTPIPSSPCMIASLLLYWCWQEKSWISAVLIFFSTKFAYLQFNFWSLGWSSILYIEAFSSPRMLLASASKQSRRSSIYGSRRLMQEFGSRLTYANNSSSTCITSIGGQRWKVKARALKIATNCADVIQWCARTISRARQIIQMHTNAQTQMHAALERWQERAIAREWSKHVSTLYYTMLQPLYFCANIHAYVKWSLTLPGLPLKAICIRLKSLAYLLIISSSVSLYLCILLSFCATLQAGDMWIREPNLYVMLAWNVTLQNEVGQIKTIVFLYCQTIMHALSYTLDYVQSCICFKIAKRSTLNIESWFIILLFCHIISNWTVSWRLIIS